MLRFFLCAAIILAISSTAVSVHAACTSPSASDGAKEWDTGTANYKICINSTWVFYTKAAIAGNPTCSLAAQIDYDTSGNYYQLCDGTNWYKVDSSSSSCSGTPTTYTTPGTYSYTVPSSCDTVVVETYGAGGGGTSARGGSGGGGAGGRDSAGTHNGCGGGYAS